MQQLVRTQQDGARTGAAITPAIESVLVSELIERALRISNAASRSPCRVIRDFDDVGKIEIDANLMLQILVNLIRNAQQAMRDTIEEDKTLTLGADVHDGELVVRVGDNGAGISKDDLGRHFTHGFTTSQDGHGFGLHSSLIAAQSLNGTLSVESDGIGKGAVFTLSVPVTKRTRLMRN